MKFLLKISGFKITWMALLALSLHLSGCGLGTEVGNGVKPHGDDKEKKAGSQADPAQQEDAKNSDGGTEDDELDSGKGGVPTSNDNAQNSVKPSAPGDFDFDVNILLNSCASPFEAEYNGVIALSAANKAGKLSKIAGTFIKETDVWELKDAFGKILGRISDNGTAEDHMVLVTDADNKPLDAGYTCSEVSGSASNNLYTYSVVLTKNSMTTGLSWTVDKSGETDRLISIGIKPDTNSTSIITLDLKK